MPDLTSPDGHPPDPKREAELSALHPLVEATPHMPVGRMIGFVVDPGQRAWEVVLHGPEQQYTVRTPPGFDGVDDTAGLMYRTDFATVAVLTRKYGTPVPRDVRKALAKGKVPPGWAPGASLMTTIGGVLYKLTLATFVEKMVAEDFEGTEETIKKPWWQRAAEKLGLGGVKKRAAAKADEKPS